MDHHIEMDLCNELKIDDCIEMDDLHACGLWRGQSINNIFRLCAAVGSYV
jgi:hypothetical protein